MGVLKRLLRVLAGSLLAVAVPLTAAAQGAIRDAEIEGILREYSDPIFEAAGLSPKDVDIYIINDPSLNAFVAGGQRVHLHTGLIMASDTPEELKGVIAHETGHISGGHSVTRGQAMNAGTTTSLISIGLGVLAIAAGAPDAGMALIGSAPQFGMLTIFKFTRNEESQADQDGLRFLEATGQSAEGLVTFMERFRYMELMSESRREPYFRSHPVSTDRVGVMRARATEVTAKSKPQSEEALDQLAIMKAKLVGFLQPAARVYNKYPKTDLSVPARYARAIAAYRDVDIKTATAETQSLIDEDPGNPYYQELMGQILFENSRVDDSIPPHRKSVELAPDQPLLKVNLARSLIETGKEDNLKEAEGLLIDAIANERDNAFAWNQLAKAYGKLNRVGDADLATAEEAYAIGDTQRAFIFAKRATGKLDADTPNGRRASDISAITDPRLR
ncbi:MAG: M48 family metalloprotease, partial [Alphaproteobacteria bacterium]|nr:M48 family metalloprotease [Alphaproteobacteria bacterium]